jgi:hypothetical protein
MAQSVKSVTATVSGNTVTIKVEGGPPSAKLTITIVNSSNQIVQTINPVPPATSLTLGAGGGGSFTSSAITPAGSYTAQVNIDTKLQENVSFNIT